jgi:uncharacterized membrane protein
MKKNKIIILGIILLFFIVGAYFWPQMPEKMASHWDIQGQVNGYMPKFWGLFLMPIISIGIFLLLILIPKMDPLKANIEKFKKYFDKLIVLIILFLFYVYFLTIFYNLGIRFNMSQYTVPAFGVLFYYCGVLIEKTKRNWSIGIRTPWTLSSDKVWDKTHRLGGKLFKIAGVLAFLGVIFPNYAFFFIIFPVIAVAIYTVVYSYLEYRKERAEGN